MSGSVSGSEISFFPPTNLVYGQLWSHCSVRHTWGTLSVHHIWCTVFSASYLVHSVQCVILGVVFSAAYMRQLFGASYLGHSVQCVILGVVFSAAYMRQLFGASYLGHSVQCIIVWAQCSVHHTWGTVFRASYLGHSVQCIILWAQCSVHHTWGTVFSASYLGHSVPCIILGAQCSVHHTWGTVFSTSDQGTCHEDGICPLLIVPFIESRITPALSYGKSASSETWHDNFCTKGLDTRGFLCLSIGVCVSWNDYVNIWKQMVEDFSGVLLQKFCTSTERNYGRK